jgi:hypothetical protein
MGVLRTGHGRKCEARPAGDQDLLGDASGPGDESAARVAFPLVLGGVGEPDADGVDVVADLIHHAHDLFGDREEAIGLRRDDADSLGRGSPEDWLPSPAGRPFGNVVEEHADIDDGQVGGVADVCSPYAVAFLRKPRGDLRRLALDAFRPGRPPVSRAGSWRGQGLPGAGPPAAAGGPPRGVLAILAVRADRRQVGSGSLRDVWRKVIAEN